MYKDTQYTKWMARNLPHLPVASKTNQRLKRNSLVVHRLGLLPCTDKGLSAQEEIKVILKKLRNSLQLKETLIWPSKPEKNYYNEHYLDNYQNGNITRRLNNINTKFFYFDNITLKVIKSVLLWKYSVNILEV